MNGEQDLIFDFPIDKNGAKERALQYLREGVGSVPIPDEPVRRGDVWIIPIMARYPRIIQNAITKRPERVRHMHFKNLGEIRINADTGDIIEKSGIVEIEGNIKNNLREINVIVQKALVKVGAKKFSQLPFPDLRFTPIQDIISNLLIKNKIELSDFYDLLYDDGTEKYKRYMQILETEPINLIRITRDSILPGNNFIEIEYELNKEAEKGQRHLSTHEKLSEILAFFYLKGYEYIDAVEDVLGVYLKLAGHYYEESYENNDLVTMSIADFMDVIRDEQGYTKEKYVKLSRYLIQLEKIGLLESIKHGEETFWRGNQRILTNLQKEEEIIAPIHKILIKA